MMFLSSLRWPRPTVSRLYVDRERWTTSHRGTCAVNAFISTDTHATIIDLRREREIQASKRGSCSGTALLGPTEGRAAWQECGRMAGRTDERERVRAYVRPSLRVHPSVGVGCHCRGLVATCNGRPRPTPASVVHSCLAGRRRPSHLARLRRSRDARALGLAQLPTVYRKNRSTCSCIIADHGACVSACERA